MQYDSTGMYHWCPSRNINDCLMDRQEAAMTILQVSIPCSLLDNAPNYVVGCIIQKRSYLIYAQFFFQTGWSLYIQRNQEIFFTEKTHPMFCYFWKNTKCANVNYICRQKRRKTKQVFFSWKRKQIQNTYICLHYDTLLLVYSRAFLNLYCSILQKKCCYT